MVKKHIEFLWLIFRKEETLIGESYAKNTDKDIADPLALKPRPDTMSKTLTTEEIDVDEFGTVVESQKKREGKYIAPKLVSTLMEVKDIFTELFR